MFLWLEFKENVQKAQVEDILLEGKMDPWYEPGCVGGGGRGLGLTIENQKGRSGKKTKLVGAGGGPEISLIGLHLGGRQAVAVYCIYYCSGYFDCLETSVSLLGVLTERIFIRYGVTGKKTMAGAQEPTLKNEWGE